MTWKTAFWTRHGSFEWQVMPFLPMVLQFFNDSWMMFLAICLILHHYLSQRHCDLFQWPIQTQKTCPWSLMVPSATQSLCQTWKMHMAPRFRGVNYKVVNLMTGQPFWIPLAIHCGFDHQIPNPYRLDVQISTFVGVAGFHEPEEIVLVELRHHSHGVIEYYVMLQLASIKCHVPGSWLSIMQRSLTSTCRWRWCQSVRLAQRTQTYWYTGHCCLESFLG
jgi:hypothetical protein